MRAPLLALVVLTAGCIAATEAPEAAPDVRTDDAALRAIEASFEGRALANPAQPFLAEHKLDVPTGAVGVNGTLSWSDPAARFRLELVDPYGETAAVGYAERAGRLVVATVDPPASGEWTYRVTSTLAADAPYSLAAVAELLVPQNNTVRQTTQLRANGFDEVNVIMEADATFTFSFESSAPVDWDVHSHPGTEVKYWQKGSGTTGEGSFTAPERGIYSLLFRNPNALPVDLRYEMVGAFRLHSHAQ